MVMNKEMNRTGRKRERDFWNRPELVTAWTLLTDSLYRPHSSVSSHLASSSSTDPSLARTPHLVFPLWNGFSWCTSKRRFILSCWSKHPLVQPDSLSPFLPGHFGPTSPAPVDFCHSFSLGLHSIKNDFGTSKSSSCHSHLTPTQPIRSLVSK